jgi:hypothetical protein
MSVPVTWTNLVGCVVDGGNQLRKTAVNGTGNGGAFGTYGIVNGFMEFFVESETIDIWAGLSLVDTDQHWNTIDFCIAASGANTRWFVLESGSVKWGSSAGAFNAATFGYPMKVLSDNGVIKYYINNILVYTSLVVPSYPLYVDNSIYQQTARIVNCEIQNGTLPIIGRSDIHSRIIRSN